MQSETLRKWGSFIIGRKRNEGTVVPETNKTPYNAIVKRKSFRFTGAPSEMMCVKQNLPQTVCINGQETRTPQEKRHKTSVRIKVSNAPYFLPIETNWENRADRAQTQIIQEQRRENTFGATALVSLRGAVELKQNNC